MGAYLVTFNANRKQDSDNLDAIMESLEAVAIGECLWGIELATDVDDVCGWLQTQLGIEDEVVVIKLRPRLEQSTQNISARATRWLDRVLNIKGNAAKLELVP
ncbi:hypothetical protein SAMN04488523_11724 [Sulfitobacter brevis]|uniref:Uncharacterized protein n=1 Tax=Sulfitobacter brevis TaxID=74348 RepID=A0A1I2FS39_9RHOB|nr:hypothetical protein [Sulfitobacter brevis]SFF07823.1 hypothetical protein SAMN04488523_11724 [Sulfitobacter brevis]